MRIIEPYVEFLTPFNREAVLKRIEECGRTAYKSTPKEDSAAKFCVNVIDRKHESVLEHVFFTVRIVCDRGVSHELVRHRLASYTQESTRYCNYSKNRFGREITVIQPCFFKPGTYQYDLWYQQMLDAETAYMALLDAGATPQEARSVLPNSLKTEVVMTANIREWRHFFELRCAKDAHPQMRQIAWLIFDRCRCEYPELFGDILEKVYEGDPEYEMIKATAQKEEARK